MVGKRPLPFSRVPYGLSQEDAGVFGSMRDIKGGERPLAIGEGGGLSLEWDTDEEREEWLSQALLTLRAAEEMLLGDLAGDCIANSFLAMIYAARAVLVGREGEVTTWEEVIRRFREAAVDSGMSPENRRALLVVAELYRRVFVAGDMEADPVTASACLDDARSFLEEVAGKLGFTMPDEEEADEPWNP